MRFAIANLNVGHQSEDMLIIIILLLGKSLFILFVFASDFSVIKLILFVIILGLCK